MPAGSNELRDLLARHPSGVAVVTAFAGPGEVPVGLTVTAFCSVSARPPLVLVCVDSASNTLPAIRRSRGFVVNLIDDRYEALALEFASKREDKFANVPWIRPGAAPGPVLAEHTTAHLVCETEREIEAGDHWVVIGRVLEAEAAASGRPLVYHDRAFRRLTE